MAYSTIFLFIITLYSVFCAIPAETLFKVEDIFLKIKIWLFIFFILAGVYFQLNKTTADCLETEMLSFSKSMKVFVIIESCAFKGRYSWGSFPEQNNVCGL